MYSFKSTVILFLATSMAAAWLAGWWPLESSQPSKLSNTSTSQYYITSYCKIQLQLIVHNYFKALHQQHLWYE